MSSRDTGLTLMIGILVAIVGYILWQLTIGLDTKTDDIHTILSNSASGATMITIASVLIAIGLVVHAAGLISTRGTASGTWETLGIISIVSAIAIWVTTSGLGVSLAEMGEKYVPLAAGAAAGNAAAAAGAGTIQAAAGFTQATNVASGTIGSLLAGIGWICIGVAYRGSDAKGALSFIPLGWLALLAGSILLVVNLVLPMAMADGGLELASTISGICFLLIVLWSVLRGIALIQE
jgi:hypothetical protein